MRWLLTAVLCVGCSAGVASREAEVVAVLARADDVMLHTRPLLVRGKYERMSGAPFDFYRGCLPLFRHDWELGHASRSAFVDGLPPVWGLADPHPENFGTLVAGDGTAALEPNDFDSADRVPYLFDLRRLTVGMALGARTANASLDTVAIGAATARGYIEALVGYGAGRPLERFDSTLAAHDEIAADLFRRSARDLAERSELAELTDGAGHFRRGAIDPAEPTQTLEDLPAFASAALPDALSRLGVSADDLLDSVRELGSGVASWPRIRFLVLLRGERIVEVKELGESMVAGWYRPVLPAADVPARVEGAARRAWARPDADPRFVAGALLGVPVLIRTESGAHKNVRVSRFTGSRATQQSLEAFGTLLGALLARVHARSERTTIGAIVERIETDRSAFIAEQGAFADVASAQVITDQAVFTAALERLGPTLGVASSPLDTPIPAVTALFGATP